MGEADRTMLLQLQIHICQEMLQSLHDVVFFDRMNCTVKGKISSLASRF